LTNVRIIVSQLATVWNCHITTLAIIESKALRTAVANRPIPILSRTADLAIRYIAFFLSIASIVFRKHIIKAGLAVIIFITDSTPIKSTPKTPVVVGHGEALFAFLANRKSSIAIVKVLDAMSHFVLDYLGAILVGWIEKGEVASNALLFGEWGVVALATEWFIGAGQGGCH
jgi:hypothetical protein